MKRIRKGIGILLLASLAVAGAFAGYLIVARSRPLALPSPTGSYAIGRTVFDWVDANRVDSLSNRPGAQRELLVWVWYPADFSDQGAAATYVPAAWAQARDEDQGLSRYLEHDFSSIETHTRANVPLAEAQGAFPVIIMQPGMGPVPTDYTVFAENLASHGYVVLGINPTDTSNLIVYPDGRVTRRTDKGTIPEHVDRASTDRYASQIGRVWSEDAIFVLDQLPRLDGDKAGLFYNKLDLAHVGLFGHSFGGATAARVCSVDVRCKAGADLDGTLFSYQAEETLQTAFMFMVEDGCGDDCQTMHQAYAAATSAGYYLAIKGARHFNFSDLPLRWLPPARLLFNLAGYIGPLPPEHGLEIANTYLVAFFDRYLQGVDSALLHGPSSAYPEVQFEKR